LGYVRYLRIVLYRYTFNMDNPLLDKLELH